MQFLSGLFKNIVTDIRIGALEKQRLYLGLYERKKIIKKNLSVDVILLMWSFWKERKIE